MLLRAFGLFVLIEVGFYVNFRRVTLRNMLHPKLAKGSLQALSSTITFALLPLLGFFHLHFSVMPPGRPRKERTPEKMRLVLEAQQLSVRRYYEK